MDLDRARRNNKCYACGESGHFSRDCPHKIKINDIELTPAEWEAAQAYMQETADEQAQQEEHAQDFQDA